MTRKKDKVEVPGLSKWIGIIFLNNRVRTKVYPEHESFNEFI